jgi:hypothetical protein
MIPGDVLMQILLNLVVDGRLIWRLETLLQATGVT